jgi:hypothetical protein
VRESVTNILRRALRLVEEQCAQAHAEMVASLDGMAMAVTVAGEDSLVLRCGMGGLREGTPSGGRAEIRLATDRESVQALLAGRTTLNGSIRSGAVELAGTVEALGRGVRAFEYFVCALLRIDEAEGLRRELEG